jgi:tetratricopeptide (TPR) repeat protein
MKRFVPFGLLLILGVAPIGASPAQQTRAPPPAAEAKDEPASATLDRLYARLARTRFPEEAQGILAEIDSLRLQSGSDAADLLLARALKARRSAQLELSLQLFDTVVNLYPDWSKAWSERANARFLSGDLNGSMGDLAQTLKREPRDISALAGLGQILLDAGDPEASLRAFDRALALAPAYEPLKEARARAQNQLWSRTP